MNIIFFMNVMTSGLGKLQELRGLCEHFKICVYFINNDYIRMLPLSDLFQLHCEAYFFLPD